MGRVPPQVAVRPGLLRRRYRPRYVRPRARRALRRGAARDPAHRKLPGPLVLEEPAPRSRGRRGDVAGAGRPPGDRHPLRHVRRAPPSRRSTRTNGMSRKRCVRRRCRRRGSGSSASARDATWRRSGRAELAAACLRHGVAQAFGVGSVSALDPVSWTPSERQLRCEEGSVVQLSTEPDRAHRAARTREPKEQCDLGRPSGNHSLVPWSAPIQPPSIDFRRQAPGATPNTDLRKHRS